MVTSGAIEESLDVSFDLAASEGQFCELFGCVSNVRLKIAKCENFF